MIRKFYSEWYCDIHATRVEDSTGCDQCIDAQWPKDDEADRECEIWNDRQPIGGFEFGDHEAIFYGE